MRYYTSDDVMGSLREKVEQAGSQKQIATELGITPQYLNDILSDKRRLTEELAAAIGFIKEPDRYIASAERPQ